jgi:hypothetical protein
MDPGSALGITLAAAFIALVAVRAYRGDYKKHMRNKTPAEYAGTGITDTWSASSFRKKDLKDRIIREYPQEEKPAAKADTRELHREKAAAMRKLLDRIKKTEGLTESSLTDIKTLECALDSMEEGIESEKTGYDMKETNIRMSYSQTRAERIIKSYPRLRNDGEMLALRKDIQRINDRLKGAQED